MKLQKVGDIPNLFLNTASGVYYVRKMVNGRQIWRTTGHTAFKSAFRRYNELMKDLADDKSGWAKKKRTPKLSDWWATYRQAKQKSPSTWKYEDSLMKVHVLPHFGNLTIDAITRSDVERFLQSKRKTLADGTVTRYQSLLTALFTAAVEEDLLPKNPLKGMFKQNYATRTVVLSLEDQAKLQRVLEPTYERWLLFMLGTGLRLDECRSIVPSRDVDWTNQLIHLVATKGQHGIKRRRTVPLLAAELIPILQEQLRFTQSDTLWVQRPTAVRHALTAGCKAAEIARVIPHTLRHTFATRYLQGGGDIYILSKILGHNSISTTEQVYAHLIAQDHLKLSAHVDLGIQRSPHVLESAHEGGA